MSCLTSRAAQMKRRLGFPRHELMSCIQNPASCGLQLYLQDTHTDTHAYAKAFCGPFVALAIPGRGCGWDVDGNGDRIGMGRGFQRGLRTGKCILQPQPATERNVSATGPNAVAGDGYVRQIALGKCIINKKGVRSLGTENRNTLPEMLQKSKEKVILIGSDNGYFWNLFFTVK